MCYRLSPNVNGAGSRFMQCQCQCHWWHWHDLGHCVLAMFRIFQVKMNTNISPGAVESSTHLWRATWLWIPVSGRGSSALLVAFGVDVWNLASVKVSRWRDWVDGHSHGSNSATFVRIVDNYYIEVKVWNEAPLMMPSAATRRLRFTLLSTTWGDPNPIFHHGPIMALLLWSII